MTDTRQLLESRGTRYGQFKDNAHIAQLIKSILRNSDKWKFLSADKKEALDMIASKMSRIMSGDPEYKDNWSDVAGYATLIADTLNE